MHSSDVRLFGSTLPCYTPFARALHIHCDVTARLSGARADLDACVMCNGINGPCVGCSARKHIWKLLSETMTSAPLAGTRAEIIFSVHMLNLCVFVWHEGRKVLVLAIKKGMRLGNSSSKHAELLRFISWKHSVWHKNQIRRVYLIMGCYRYSTQTSYWAHKILANRETFIFCVCIQL